MERVTFYSHFSGPALMSEHLQFLTHFLRRPLSVGAIAPSSSGLARLMVQDMGLADASTVVELGPGTGSFTRVIEAGLRTDALFLALELNNEFADVLCQKFTRVEIIRDSAENLCHHLEAHGRPAADVIFCGLPWASFPPELQERIMSSVLAALRPGGRFATFAYVHAAWFPTARKFHRWLRSRFFEVKKTRIVWRNLPPAFVYRCEKAGRQETPALISPPGDPPPPGSSPGA
jgi:phospholipid N-methyltransferase